MCKGSQTTTSTSAPNPQAMAAYQGLLGQAAGVAQTPFQTYGGEFVAPLNAQQNQAGANINQNAGFAQPFIDQARQYATQAAAPITGSNINQYLSPYTQDVVNATQAQFNNQNQQQLENVRGNAAAQGALGGDREAVAEGITSGQQSLAQAPVIAGLYNQGYNTALSTALQEQQNLGQSAYSLGNLGVAGQNAALTGANAQLGFGTLGQSTQQAQDQALYSQFLAQQAYPFQTTQFQAGIDTAVGSQMGGTSSTTGPPPNQMGQLLGLGLAGLSFLNRGGGVKGRAHGGKIPGFAMGGMPYDGGASYIPTMGLTMGSGAPKPPGAPGQGQQQPDPFKLASQTMDLEKKIKGLGGGSSTFGGINYGQGDWGGDLSGSDMASAAQAGVDSGLSFDPLSGDVFARGGKVRGFAGGGLADDLGSGDSFDDRFSALDSAPSADDAYHDEFRRRTNAAEGLIPGSDVQRRGWPEPTNNLGLGDIVSSYSPGFENNYGNDLGGHPGAAAAASPPSDYINPSVVNGQPQNLTGDIIPPGGFGPAPDLPPAQDVADTRPRGLGSAAMNYAPEEGPANPIRGYAPVPGSQGAPSITAGDGEKHSGFGFLDKLGVHLDPNIRKGMLAAGFAMMASRSPFLGNAVGEGGLAGLSAYSGGQKADLEAEKTHASIEDARKKLEMHADEFQKKLALDTKKVQQQEEHQQYLKDFAKERLEQGKYSAIPGMGQNDRGEQTPGSYILNGKTGQTEFRPGMVQTPKAAAASEPTLSPETRQFMARAYLKGDYRQMQNLGRGAQGAANIVALREDIRKEAESQGLSPEQAAVKAAEFQGLAAGERALGTRTAQIEMAANEARNMMKPALDLSDKMSRTNWTPVNRALQAYQSGTSDPTLAAWGAANFSLVNTYVRAIAPTGVPPESAREHALQMLNTAMGPDAYRAVVNQMDVEMKAALAAPEQVRDKFRSMYGGAPGGGGTAAPAGVRGSPQDQAALQWANANPNDPRAAQIKQRLGVQ